MDSWLEALDSFKEMMSVSQPGHNNDFYDGGCVCLGVCVL